MGRNRGRQVGKFSGRLVQMMLPLLRSSGGRPSAAHFPNHEDGEVSRHLPTGDRAAPSRRIQQRRQGPLSFNDEHFCRREQRPAKRGKGALRHLRDVFAGNGEVRPH